MCATVRFHQHLSAVPQELIGTSAPTGKTALSICTSRERLRHERVSRSFASSYPFFRSPFGPVRPSLKTSRDFCCWSVSTRDGNEGQTAHPGKAPFDGKGTLARILILVPESVETEADSPFKDASWLEVLEHIGRRLNWSDERLVTSVVPVHPSEGSYEAARDGLERCDLAVGVGLHDSRFADWIIAQLFKPAEGSGVSPPNAVFLDCSDRLGSVCCLGGRPINAAEVPAWRRAVASWKLPFDGLAEALEVWSLVKQLWYRHSSEDLVYALLVLVNKYVVEVPLVSGQLKEKTDLRALMCMMGNCREEVFGCLNDPECKAGLDCLESCALNDQVCSYRCIVSHESPLLEAFSLCILQKHNCLGNSAEIPMRPKVDAMTHFRGKPLTWEVAEQLFIGWLGNQPSSWRVVAGKNPAYDYFPCQYQLFYPGKAKGSMWYEPVFKVTKYDGTEVWRRRKYRMRRAEAPGYYHFSVLDNGVISKEYWRIVDVDDGLEWGLFYYSGAASVVGQTYQGAVFVTRDGKWPDDRHLPRIEASLDAAGIKMWELYGVDQSCCDDTAAPLAIDDMRPFDSLV
uniref:Violaxanthin de-chloroplastic n=1 Tax=Tetraselmis sp. GSL018 TaxID=582737 RepID=A0A061SC93_9CHLO